MRDLNVKQIEALSKPGMHRVSKNLYLQIGPTGTKAWLFRYMKDGRSHGMGLGRYDLVTLTEARAEAMLLRKQLFKGIDPLEERRAKRAQEKLHKATSVTFRECARRYIEAHAAGWRNSKHRTQWENTLDAYVHPVIGDLPVAGVDSTMVFRIIEPIWTTKTETASRLRGRMESILDWATARHYRTGENPARWRGHLDKLLPPKSKVAPTTHHKAVPYADLPAFMAQLHDQTGVAARCLEFTILTATRTSEAREAQWSEIDLQARTWTIPAARVKAGKAHVVPLSDRALQLLAALPRSGDFVFENGHVGKPIGAMGMSVVLQRVGRGGTVHGFRSTFRDWAAEQTHHPNHVVEMALAHVIGDKVEAAYRRGDLLAKRRELMQDWAGYCTGATSP
jgi:integrase